jgi:hypothetical protein
MCVVEFIAHENNGGSSSPHAMQFGMSGSVFQNALMRNLKAGEQQRSDVGFGSLGKNLFDRVDGNATGFLTAFVAAHSVGNNCKSALAREFFIAGGLPVSVLVLVVIPLAANVAQAGQLYSGPYLHYTSRVFLDQAESSPVT